MTFIVQNLTPEDLDRVYAVMKTSKIYHQMLMREYWREESIRKDTWAIEPETGTFLYLLPFGRESVSVYEYLFCMDGVGAKVYLNNDDLFAFLQISDGLKNKITEVQEKIRHAIAIAGLEVNGNAKPGGIEYMPDARFAPIQGNAQ